MVRNARIVALLSLTLVVAGCGSGDAEAPDTVEGAEVEGNEVEQTAPEAADDDAPAGDQVDLTGVDPCSLIDEATIQQITGESVGFTTQDTGDFPVGCFWGAVVPGVPAYVDLTIQQRPDGLSGYSLGILEECAVEPSDAVGDEARAVTCADSVHLLAAERRLLVQLTVDEPTGPITPDDLAPVVQGILAQL